MADITGFRWLVFSDTSSNLASSNPTLLAGESAIETDTGKKKTGDGTTTWNSLRYVNGQAGSESITENGSVTIPLGYDTYRINIDTTSADITLTVGDGQFDGQRVIFKETGGGNVAYITGTNIETALADGYTSYIWNGDDSEWGLVGDSHIVRAEYKCSGNSITTSETVVDFNIEVEDTHNAVTTGSAWEFTAPIGGVYQVSVSGLTDQETWAAGGLGLRFYLNKNGSLLKAFQSDYRASGTSRASSGGTVTVRASKGDTLSISAQTTVATNLIDSATNYNWITIERIGN